jgi:hypothetical protein
MKNAKRNWKTTLAGILTLLATGVGIYINPAILLDPQQAAVTAGAITAGVGLIAAKDSDKTGVSAVPAATAAAEPKTTEAFKANY